ncbi:phosphate transport regulator [Megasphaera cerevisiae DSM 20462]|jgi:uncharacterized protein Yka (UPF0111/DUF47 family)|uniref:Phosphate transport regulator n=1 Tax=Megasphaera cerevisiae DSM 20462 TaxID=1122219 RepID=A0A0J6WUC2_9FIRM|nr:DUF47 family protein [Megasphaera cerevisiae]KMO86124.1 phosphate transport regulator [Megasphaera cerevisiae DSM 20462]MCI1751276.1 DUF47 family protein [Megasphaera cerevisiae]OKY52631.1 phosphate transport regulator [Megasphaera cerevisiae]SKA04838.1 hypothetical protein SAMN05660900_02237 [Megasphaera cerevisiae DSM 20462]
MAFHLKPKEEKFFSLLDQHAALSYQAAELLRQAMNEEILKEEALEKIDSLAERADELVMETMKRLQKTFITPMDREDIQQLIDQLDAAIDSISDIMDKMCMYRIGEATAGAKQMTVITATAMKEIRKSIGYMKDLKKNYLKVEARSKKVLKLEQECDDLYHEEMARLFTKCKDPIEIIKWKEILQSVEDVTDDCEHLVITFRKVVLKYA